MLKVITIALGIGASAIAVLVSRGKAAETEEMLTLNIDYDSIDGCALGDPITFSGYYTVMGKVREGVNIYVVNEDAYAVFGPSRTTIDGSYSISANAPGIVGTYHYLAYTEHQLPE